MAPSLRLLRKQVIVVTGASSGIGLATARMAARLGAKVVLAARNTTALSAAAAEIQRKGGTAAYISADVSDRRQVQAVADMAIKRFGGFDTWVNNAGVDVWGRLEQVTEEDSRRLFETNFWGVVNGSLVAVAHLKAKGGAVVNLGSLASDRAFPLQGMYSATKHAIKAFTDALRMELEQERAKVSITLIKPAAIGTPLALQAKNYLPQEPRLPSPLYAPEEVAHAILHAAVHPKRDIYIGSVSKAISAAGRGLPRSMDRYSETALFDAQMRDQAARPRRDNLHAAGPMGGVVRADAEGRPMRVSAYTRASLHPFASGAGLLALAAFAGAALGFRKSPRG